jgi:hypothetical protein
LTYRKNNLNIESYFLCFYSKGEVRASPKRPSTQTTVAGPVDGLERGFKERQPFETLSFFYRITPKKSIT